jgi:Zn-dependent peptidase ImmA (M78 family)
LNGNTIEVASGIWQWVQSAVILSDENKAMLNKWVSGEKSPTFNQLEDFSKKTRIPLGYFFLKTPPIEECKLLEYRTVDSAAIQSPSRDLFDTIRQMENVQEWMREYLVGNGADKINFVGTLTSSNDVLSVAANIRQVLELNYKWYENSSSLDDSFKKLKESIGAVGIVIMMNGIVGNNTRRNLNIEEFRAFTLIDEYAPLIFINSADSKGGKIFSLLHEFIHIGVGKNSLYNAGQNDFPIVSTVETFCNGVTAEIIVPLEAFTVKWASMADDTNMKISALSDYFKCSQLVIARRAFDLRFISDSEYEVAVMEAKQGFSQKSSGGGGDYYRTQATRLDHRFLFALESSVREGKTLYSDAFRLTNTNRVTFENLLMEVRGER